MGKFYKILLFLFMLLFIGKLWAQDIPSTIGKKFWITFMENDRTFEAKVYVSSTLGCTGIIRNINTNYIDSFTVAANSVEMILIPTSEANNLGSDLIADKGFLLETSEEVSVVAWNFVEYSSDAALILPEPSLGYEYITSNIQGVLRSEFSILATEDNTNIEIIPAALTKGKKPAGIPYVITLNKGQVYQVQADATTVSGDLSGTIVKSLNTKKIAVFSGTICGNVPVPTCLACDHMYEQMLPVNMWGKYFIAVPTISRNFDFIKIIASQNATTIKVNGSTKPLLNAGKADTFRISNATYIQSDKPVSVCLFAAGQLCGGGKADPMMVWIHPLQQTISEILFPTLFSTKVNDHYVNIVTKTSNKNSVILNSMNIGSSFLAVPALPDYSYARIKIPVGHNSITADSGLLAFAYGYGEFESYGFTAGAHMTNLSQLFTANGSASYDPDTVSICSKKVELKGYAEYTVLAWKWYFGDGDSSDLQNPAKTYSDTGIYTITLITTRTNFKKDTSKKVVRLSPAALVNILNNDTTICSGQPVFLKSKGTDQYTWNNINTLSCFTCPNPVANPIESTKYVVHGRNIGNPYCFSFDTVTILVRPLLIQIQSIDTIICVGQSAKISTLGYGGMENSYVYSWNNSLGSGNTKTVNPKKTTVYQCILQDGCSSPDTALIKVTVRPPLNLKLSDDTLICTGREVLLNATISGGYPFSSFVRWNNSLGTGLSKKVKPETTTIYQAILYDNCTALPDTEEVTVTIKSPLKLKISPDTNICKGADKSFDCNSIRRKSFCLFIYLE